MSRRRRILIAIDSFVPAYLAGGPIQVAANLALALREEFDVAVACGAYDLGRVEPLDGIHVDRWTEWNGIPVRYLPREEWQGSTWTRLLEERQPDWLYLNGAFSPSFTLTPLRAARPRLTAGDMRVGIHPHGMFGPGALAVKPLKKRLFLAWARATGFYRDVLWLASSDDERAEVRRTLPRADVTVRPNLPAPPRFTIEEALARKPSDHLRFLSVGRILPIKNVHFGIERLRDLSWDRPVEVHVVGPAEDPGYRDQIAALDGDQVRVILRGSLPPHEVAEEYARAHYLLHPSKNENYGYSIVEALANGCPVICSDRTPWRDLEGHGVGIDLPLESQAWSDRLPDWLGVPEAAYRDRVAAAQAYFLDTIQDDALLEANRAVFRAPAAG